MPHIYAGCTGPYRFIIDIVSHRPAYVGALLALFEDLNLIELTCLFLAQLGNPCRMQNKKVTIFI